MATILHRSRVGFTLIELIAVLLLLVIVGSVVVNRAGNSTNRVPATADILIQNLTYARSRAMSTTNTWQLTYGGAGVSLLRDGAAVSLPDRSTATIPADVSITGGDGQVTFDAFGAPDAQKVITVSDGELTRTVIVWAETGLVE